MLSSENKNNIDFIPKLFLIVAIIFGITFSFLVPFYQTPDEYSHYPMMYEELGLKDKFSNEVKEYNDSFRIVIHYEEKVNTKKNLNLKYKFKLNDISLKPSINIIKHFPQNIVLYIVSVLRLPIFIGTSITELSALAFYIIMCYYALKKMPIKKELMMFIMILPMSMQQASSVSYDVILLSCCHLLVSNIFYIKYEKEIFTLKDLIKIMILLLIIGFIKLPYSLLGLLLFLIPSNKIHFIIGKLTIDKKSIYKYKKILYSIFGSLILLLIFIVFKFRKVLLKNNLVRIMASFCLAPLSSLKLLCRTIMSQHHFYLNSFLGNFGWLDTPTPKFLRIIILLMLIIMVFVNFNCNNRRLNIKEKIFLWIVCLLILLLIMIPMYSWSLGLFSVPNYNTLTIIDHVNQIKAMNYIAGVQGRYFIPFVILMLLPINCKKITSFLNKINFKIVLIAYYIFVYICIVIILLQRYWIS